MSAMCDKVIIIILCMYKLFFSNMIFLQLTSFLALKKVLHGVNEFLLYEFSLFFKDILDNKNVFVIYNISML